MYLLGASDSWKREFVERACARRKVKIVRANTIEPYLEDYTFFSLAPLYVHGGIGYSMPDQFEIEAKEQRRLVVDYQRTVIGSLGRWGSIVEGIDREVWDDFCHYLSTCMFVDFGKRQIVWQVRAQEIDVEGTRPTAIVDPSKLPVRLRVFMPDGNHGRMFVKGGLPAKLWWGGAHPKVVSAAKTILKCHGRIDHAS